MKRLATALSLLALAAAPAAEAQLSPNYTITTNFTAAGSNERGVAYGAVGGNERIYMSSKNGGTFVYIYDAASGAFQNTAGSGAGSLDVTGISGGFTALNDVEVTDDGAIYGCNMTTSHVSSAFKCYYWSGESAAPAAVAFTGLPTTGTVRIGDKVRVTGSGTDTYIWLVSPAHAGPPVVPVQLFRCKASSATAFDCTNHDLSSVGVAGITNGSASPNPGSTTSVWVNGNGVLPRLVTIPAVGSSGAATLVTNIPATQLGGGAGTGNNSIYAFKNDAGDSTYVAIYEYSSGVYQRGRIVNVTPIVNSGTNVGVYSWGVTASGGAITSSGFGDITLRPITVPATRKGDSTPAAAKAAAAAYDVIVLAPNNGMVSAQTSNGSLPVELVNFAGVASGSTARLS
ncbi:MAG: hypothetical protein IAE99_10970, partial [Rhodothermales bacterium]|nr:hypothetical protein [Rhodothermales bacterium]